MPLFLFHSSYGGEGRMVAIEQIVLSACVTIFSLGLLVVSVASYQKYRNTKLLLVGVVFFVFFIKGVLLSLRLFFSDLSFIDTLFTGSYSGLFDLCILVLLFVATLKR